MQEDKIHEKVLLFSYKTGTRKAVQTKDYFKHAFSVISSAIAYKNL